MISKMKCTIAGSLCALAAGFAGAAETPADLVLTDARIYTANATRSMAEAVAVRGGRAVTQGTALTRARLAGWEALVPLAR